MHPSCFEQFSDREWFPRQSILNEKRYFYPVLFCLNGQTSKRSEEKKDSGIEQIEKGYDSEPEKYNNSIFLFKSENALQQ